MTDELTSFEQALIEVLNDATRGKEAMTFETNATLVLEAIAKAIAAEREACAKLVDGYNENEDWPDWPWTECAAAIRARKP